MRLTSIRLLLASAALASSFSTVAQPAWPTRPVTVIEPFAAGGAVDAAVRAIVEQAGPAIGQNFIVEARPGAGTRIGTDAIL
jgi:tripartite-type tricarboxylate transporter receptor subunit TctC